MQTVSEQHAKVEVTTEKQPTLKQPEKKPNELGELWREMPPILSGILLALTFPPYSLGWLAWFALIPFYVGLPTLWPLLSPDEQQKLGRRERINRQFRPFSWGLGFGLALFLTGCWWAKMLAPQQMAVIVVWGALPFPMMAYLYAYLMPRLPQATWGQTLWRPLCFAAIYVLFEWYRTLSVYAFPWFFLSSSQVHTLPILQIVSLTTQWGLSFFIALINGLLAEAWFALIKRAEKRKALRFVALSVLLVTLATAWGQWRLQTVEQQRAQLPKRTIASIQGAVPRNFFGEIDYDRIEQTYPEMTRAAVVELRKEAAKSGSVPAFVAWPEDVIDRFFKRRETRKVIEAVPQETGLPLLFGALEWDKNKQPWNIALLLGTDGKIQQRYNKNRLAPIGEIFPERKWLGFVYDENKAKGTDFGQGKGHELFVIGEGAAKTPVGVLICWEQIFPYLARERVLDGAGLIAVLTSEDEFGLSDAPVQHADQAIVRAVETRRTVWRAASTGITEVIAPTGVVEKQIPRWQPGTLIHTVRLENERTLATRMGDGFLWLVAAVFFGSVFVAFSGRREGNGSAASESRRS